MALPPCHCFCQFRALGGGLRCHVYQRSADAMLGLPFNLASYATLTHSLARITGHRAEELVFSLGDAHIYETHADNARLQAEREPRSPPRLAIAEPMAEVDDMVADRYSVLDYDSHSPLRYVMAV